MQHKQMEELKQLKQQETLWKQKAADISARQQAAFQKEKDSLNRLIAELQQDVNAYVVLANNKDMCAVQLEKRIEQLEQQVDVATSPLNLFRQLYEAQNNQGLSGQQEDWLLALIDEFWEGDA